MSTIHLLETNISFLLLATGLLGLLVGSFLNVVVYRLPIMMERAWHRESSEYLGLSPQKTDTLDRLDLIQPGSHCPACATPVRAWQNIPIVSYLFLRGKCANCQAPISIRYPAVEAITAILSILVVWNFGWSLQSLAALILTWALLSLSLIDFDHQLLPDSITLPVLWLGLGLSILPVFADSHSAIIGAISGYLCLWLVYKMFKAVTGKEGMGYGDFKLLAMLGAWTGWQCLPLIVLLSSFVGAMIGTVLIIFKIHSRTMPIPFGPYLSAAGWIALIWGDRITQRYFDLLAGNL